MNTKEKYHYIDTLRFVAICYIVFTHFDHECFQYFMGSTVTQFFFSKDCATGWLLYGLTGKYALALLCVISGFLCAHKCSKKGADVAEIVITRYLRLMLPVAGANLLFGIWVSATGEQIDVPVYLKSSLIPGMTGANRNLWCIGSFLVGSILIAVLYYVKSRNSKGFLLAVPILVAAVIMENPWLFAVMVGGLSYEAADWLRRKQVFRYWWLVVILPILWWLPRAEESTLTHYRQIAACVVIMITLYCLPGLQKILAWKKLDCLKKYSYSLFVVHGMTLFLLGPSWEIVQKLGVQGFYATFAVLFLLTLAVDVAAAIVIYYLFEKTIYRLLFGWILPRSVQADNAEEQKLVA